MFELDAYIINLTCKYSSINSIWLIGSRANNSYKDNSDWDLLVFANQDMLDSLKKDMNFNMPEIDLLVVYDDNNFISPWPRNDKESEHKKGCLKSWQWNFVDEFSAKYKSDIGLRNATKSGLEIVEYTPQTKQFEAKKLWPK